ncbi:GntR family transcriptional regulator [Lactococcus petauri]|uniref:GntR family transcriptional regulator n=1 Tax=Lactococcus petauri TaxID=1940789 RepID=UPI001F5773AE|nr:GntR family transcriptional regulator [Lactococcus petauri]
MYNCSPLYLSMLNELIRQIESGELKENEKLPSEQQLGIYFNVSRITVRRALAELEKKKYICKKQGRGSFVNKITEQNFGIQYTDMQQALYKMGVKSRIELLNFSINVDGSNSLLRHHMNLSEDDYFYTIEQLFYGDDIVHFYKKTHLHYYRFPEIRLSEIKETEIIPFLTKKYDFINAKFSSEQFATRITKDEKKYFKQSNVGDPMLVIKSIGKESNNIFYQSETFVVGDLPLYLI